MRRLALEHGAHAAELNEAFEKGGDGAAALAEAVVDAADHPTAFDYLYPDDAPIADKIEAIAKRAYGADGIFLLHAAENDIHRFDGAGARQRADLHGEDAPLALARSGAAQRTDRLHRAGAGSAGVHRCRLARRALR